MFEGKGALTVSANVVVCVCVFFQRKCMLLGKHFENGKFGEILTSAPKDETQFSNYMKFY